jgi:hypothetical protein
MELTIAPDIKEHMTDEELAAAKQFIELAEAGKLRHNPEPVNLRFTGETSARTDQKIFNMSYAGGLAQCGSVACIGGWMYLLMKKDKVSLSDMEGYVFGHTKLNALFFPETDTYQDRFSVITPEEAVHATKNFLAGNYDEPWKGVLD